MLLGRTRAATRAAAAEAHADHAEVALAVCLQQPSFCGPDGRVAITLLAASKRLAALVARCFAGALALHLRLDNPAQADALAAWMSHHGALLAELKLRMNFLGHPAVCVLEQLPSSLMRLTLKGMDSSKDAAQQAAAFARALSRHPMQLCSLELPCSWTYQAATVLPALAALRQLTSLVMWVAEYDPSQPPMQHLPAQLQQLELVGGASTTALPWLALEHVTGLTGLHMHNRRVDGGVLPRGLRSLAVADVSNAAPLQPLEQLTALQLTNYNSDIASAEQLRQLSTLRRLEQLSVQACGYDQAGDLSDALAALGVLPLTHLSIEGQLTAACLAHLGACSRLTVLELDRFYLADGATPEQLATALARLTALERLELRFYGDTEGGMLSADAASQWGVPVCKELAQLPRLTDCRLELPRLGPEAAAQLAAATQLTELRVWGCALDDSCLATICAGLTGLRRLSVSGSQDLTNACLSSIAAMPRLMMLGLFGTAVTGSGVQQLSAARPSLQVSAATVD